MGRLRGPCVVVFGHVRTFGWGVGRARVALVGGPRALDVRHGRPRRPLHVERCRGECDSTKRPNTRCPRKKLTVPNERSANDGATEPLDLVPSLNGRQRKLSHSLWCAFLRWPALSVNKIRAYLLHPSTPDSALIATLTMRHTRYKFQYNDTQKKRENDFRLILVIEQFV